MNPIFQYIAVELTKRQLKKKKKQPDKRGFNKLLRNNFVELKHFLQESIFISLGVVAASFGLKSFLLANNFIDGGVMGISLIIAELSSIPLSILVFIINLPFLILGFSTVSRQFALKSIVAIALLSVVLHFVNYPIITEDKLLIAVFGGFFLGLGIGLSIRGGAVIDGTEVLAVFISRRTSLTIGDVILIFNIIIFFVAAYVFNIEIALYAMLTYLAAAKTVDFIVDGIEEYIGVTIISEYTEEIRMAIIDNLGRGCTIYLGKRGFAKQGEELKDTQIVYTLITRLELAKLQTELDKIDPNAFIVMHSIKDAKGGMIKKRASSKL